MSDGDQINAFLASVRDLMERAGNDPALAEQLLDAPRDVIAREVASPLPAGVDIQVARDETGALQATACLDEEFEGELDDSLLEEIAGGRAYKTEASAAGESAKRESATAASTSTTSKASKPAYSVSLKRV